jgi:hypothetical protein
VRVQCACSKKRVSSAAGRITKSALAVAKAVFISVCVCCGVCLRVFVCVEGCLCVLRGVGVC